MRRVSSRGAVLLLVLALVLAVAALAGCGGSGDTASTDSSAATTTVASDGRSADQIVKDSEAKMATVSSASFTADFAMQMQGDTSKITDPTAKALLSQGITFSATGKSANDPTAADMTMSVGIAGQTLEFGMKAEGTKAWVEYQGTWYKVDSKNAKALGEQAETGAAPTEQLKSMGVDPSTWGTEYELAGTEDMNGVRGLPRHGRRRPAEAGRLAREGRRGPEPDREARRLRQRPRPARPGPHGRPRAGQGARQDAQGRLGRLLDRRRRLVHVQGAVRRRHGHDRAGEHGRESPGSRSRAPRRWATSTSRWRSRRPRTPSRSTCS